MEEIIRNLRVKINKFFKNVTALQDRNSDSNFFKTYFTQFSLKRLPE